MLIHSIRLDNFLSYGNDSQDIALKPLNILIGPNGSGKSNLLEAFHLLQSASENLQRPIREGGGVGNWLWKGADATQKAALDVVVDFPKGPQNLRYFLSFTESGHRFELVDERVESKNRKPAHTDSHFFYRFGNGKPIVSVQDGQRPLSPEDLDFNQSILSQRKDPDQYPELTYLGNCFDKIKLYREWSFGRYTPPRLPQKADLPNDVLESDGSNLGLVLNRLRREPDIKQRLLEALRELYEGIHDYDVQIEGGTVQVFFQEGRHTIPATRLSDGTLRYLSLLAILCHPKPPPLVCIEEPELGLHPDILPTIANLLIEASERTQLVVTTHSDVLVDAMTKKPESILVCEKNEEGTVLTRLNRDDLKPWLNSYRLGELWTRGDIGGTRW